MNFSSHCPPRIKEERLRLGLSQAQAAEKTGVSREMWGRYERGDAIPGGEVLFSFASIGADIQFILTGSPQELISVQSNMNYVGLVKKFDALSDSDKQSVERIISSLLMLSQ